MQRGADENADENTEYGKQNTESRMQKRTYASYVRVRVTAGELTQITLAHVLASESTHSQTGSVSALNNTRPLGELSGVVNASDDGEVDVEDVGVENSERRCGGEGECERCGDGDAALSL